MLKQVILYASVRSCVKNIGEVGVKFGKCSYINLYLSSLSVCPMRLGKRYPAVPSDLR